MRRLAGLAGSGRHPDPETTTEELLGKYPLCRIAQKPGQCPTMGWSMVFPPEFPFSRTLTLAVAQET